MDTIIYNRISSNNQSFLQGNYASLDTQKEICVNYCSDKNLSSDNVVQEVVSAKDIKKQKGLMNILENHSNINIIISRVDRFSRDTCGALIFANKCKEKNIILHFVQDGICSNNYMDIHRLTLALSQSKFELDTHSNRITANNKNLKNKGWKFGNPSYGFAVNFKNDIRKFKVNTYEKHVIKFIVMAREGKVNCKELNKQLTKLNPVDKTQIAFYDKEGYQIEKFDKLYTLEYQEIADLLNSYNISKRNKKWTRSMIQNIYNNERNCIKHLQKMNI